MSEIQVTTPAESNFTRAMASGHANRYKHDLDTVLWRVMLNNGDETPWSYCLMCCGESVPTMAQLGLGRIPTQLDVYQAIALSVSQIRSDMDSGRVPIECPDFSTLHDYVDANEYGNLCDENSGIDWLNTDQSNVVQDAVNTWLMSRVNS